jgi:Aldehyde dehydrogenase family
VRIANDSPFGLGGSVFTSNPKHGAEVARKISTGMVFVNHPTMVKADLPFGGIRHSGYGVDINAEFSPGTSPSATIHAVPVFIWGMSDYTNHVRKPSRVQRDCHSPR